MPIHRERGERKAYHVEILLPTAVVLGGYVFFRWVSRLRLGDKSIENAGGDELASVSDLNALFTSSREHAILLFLYDPWCPVSAMATRQVAQVGADIGRIDVSRQHDLSREIERRSGVRHESPQLILIDDGVAVWDASHSGIDRNSIERALELNSAKEI